MTGHPLPNMLTRRRFTVTEYHKMVDAGILHEDDRVELLAGEIHNMSAIDAIHAAHVKRLNQLLGQLLDERFLIGVQDPILLDDLSEPEPDIAILQWRDDFYVHAHPVPEEILLLIEVANTSVHYDRTIKVPSYARASINEVWLVNIKRQVVEQYTQPDDNEYVNCRIIKRGAISAQHPALDLTLSIDTIFGPLKSVANNQNPSHTGNGSQL